MSQPVLLTVCVLFGFVLVVRLCFFFSSPPSLQEGQTVVLSTTLLSEPVSKPASQMLVLQQGREKVLVFAPLFPRLHYGDSVRISGMPERLEKKEDSSNDREVLHIDQPIFTIYSPHIEATEKGENLLLAIFSTVRTRIKAVFYNTLDHNLSSLLLGIVFGSKGQWMQTFLLHYKQQVSCMLLQPLEQM